MRLGQFSVSITVKNIKKSREFYEKLGFRAFDDHEEENWIIMHNGETFIGLFQSMFTKNILTFNPADVRSIQQKLKDRGLTLDKEADETTTGPESIMLTDPDGNAILIDQHDENYRPTSKM